MPEDTDIEGVKAALSQPRSWPATDVPAALAPKPLVKGGRSML